MVTTVRLTKEKLLQLLREATPRANASVAVQDDTDLRELGIDSLSLMMLVVRFCEDFGVDPAILSGRVEAIRSVGSLLALGERLLDAETGAQNGVRTEPA